MLPTPSYWLTTRCTSLLTHNKLHLIDSQQEVTFDSILLTHNEMLPAPSYWLTTRCLTRSRRRSCYRFCSRLDRLLSLCFCVSLRCGLKTNFLFILLSQRTWEPHVSRGLRVGGSETLGSFLHQRILIRPATLSRRRLSQNSYGVEGLKHGYLYMFILVTCISYMFELSPKTTRLKKHHILWS